MADEEDKNEEIFNKENPEQPESGEPVKPDIGDAAGVDNSVENEYYQLSQQAPAKDVVAPAPEEAKVKSITESMDDATDLTDMQFAMAKMFPKKLSVDDVMVGRISPEAFMALLQLMITNDVMMSDPTKQIDVNAITVRNYIKLTIGLDGRGRIDVAELAGAAREQRKEESILKGI